MKKTSHFLFAAITVLAIVFSCGKPENNNKEENQEQNQGQEEIELEPFQYSCTLASENHIFEGKPVFNLHLVNPNAVAATAEIKLTINTDKNKKYVTVELEQELAAKSSADIALTTADNLAPGFYRATGKVGKKTFLSSVPFGVDPFQIVSAPDKQDDFDAFWDAAYDQLKGVDMNVSFVPTKYSGTYMVVMQSIPDGLEGDPMVIRGYYVEPVADGKKHPAIVHYYGYDDFPGTGKLYCPSGQSDFAHLYLSTRGQRLNARVATLRDDGIEEDYVNPYDKQWFTVNFGDKDSYYYRGAYMDCVQGIRFLALCEDEKVKGRIDTDNIFVEGMSQGGAFSYAATALSKEYPVRALAAAVAFMGDFPDYFVIAANDGGGFPYMAQTCKKELSWDDAKMYAFLSYFDTKNLATRVNCPIMACIGLMDRICPAHTNIAPYNNALTPAADKQMTFYPNMDHAVPNNWDSSTRQFFKNNMK
ncbi:MAG: acetylxylan esterase [Bacteroidales bacterium]|nr:acetylxylan esterase [Bacteroidales bacterium]